MLRLVYATLNAYFLKARPAQAKRLALKKKRRSVRAKKVIKYFFARHDAPYRAPGRLGGKLIRTSHCLLRKSAHSFPKALFHIKCLFDIEEFSVYDAYNFYRSEANPFSVKKRHASLNIPIRINFFYRIRESIRLFRTHTLRVFKTNFKSERRVNLFFKAFTHVGTASYMWFFEFNIAVFLVKLNFSDSIYHAHMLVQRQWCAHNFDYPITRWTAVNPGDVISLPVSKKTLTWLHQNLLLKYNVTKKYKKLLKRLFFGRKTKKTRDARKNAAMPWIWSKQKPFKLIEVDPKTFTAVLLPYKNNSAYLKLIFVLWLNYWNYRVTLWKYDN